MTAHSSTAIRVILGWYLSTVFARFEGGGILPFYCNGQLVGHAAVSPSRLANGSEFALFQLFMVLSMYQARRDTLVQAQQRTWKKGEATDFLSLRKARRLIASGSCSCLDSPQDLRDRCEVSKTKGKIICHKAAEGCPVCRTAEIWGRMAHLGKIQVSAVQQVWHRGGISKIRQTAEQLADPIERIEFVVESFARIHGIGRKLATLYVSALSTPALAPGLTPWESWLDGNLAVVIDTHVANGIEVISEGRAGRSYQSKTDWLREKAALFDLRQWHSDLPPYSPRLLQQALYAYCSKSNRDARGLACQSHCVPGLCPYHEN